MKTCRALLGLSLIAGILCLAGCGQNPFAPPAAGGGGGAGGGGNAGGGGGKPGTAPAPNATGGGIEMSLTSKIKKKIDFLDWKNEMMQLGQFYTMFSDERRHPPKTVKELQDYFKRDWPKLVTWVDDGHYVVIPNMKLSSNNIIVYQNKDLRFGTRYVVKGDGSFHELPEAEFQAELKQQQLGQ